MRILSGIALSFMAASPALSQDERIVISAGEHDNYSRIAFHQSGGDIAIEQTGRTVRLRNVTPGASFDFSNINDRRKAYRILSAKKVSGGDGEAIELLLNCDCSVRTSTLGNGKFVLDVLSSAPEKTATAPQTLDQKVEAATERVGQAPSQEDILSVAQAHDQMVALLKQAASEGLITIKGDGASETANESPAQPSEPAERIALQEPPAGETPQETSEPEPHPAAVPVTHASTEPVSTAACVANTDLIIDGAALEENPLVAIAELQSQLAGDDGEHGAAARQLIDGYLSIGFGDEALALLSDNGAGDTVLADIARTVAERDVSDTGPLLGAQNCRGAHALWQAAANAPEAALAQYQRAGDAIETLPTRLRALIATRLAMKFVAIGAMGEAEELYNIAAALVEKPGPDLQYIRARLDQDPAHSEDVRDTLLEIAGSNSGASDDALLTLADSYSRREAQPHEGFTEDIGALARLGGSSRAMLAEADAWAKLGNLDAALFLLQSVSQKSGDDLHASRVSAQTIFDEALVSEDDQLRAAALEAFLKHKAWFAPDQLATGAKTKTARASQEFGLPNLAFSLLNNIKDRYDAEFMKTKAAAALAAGYVQDAIATAAPYAADPAFGEIVVKANLAGGQYNAALAAAGTLKDETLKAAWTSQAGWMARSWASAAESFRALDPNTLDERTALQFSLTAYKANASAPPAAADAVLSQSNETLAAGTRSLFSTPAQGSALQRSRQEVENANREIQMIEEILSDG